jgi:hypothetical protein
MTEEQEAPNPLDVNAQLDNVENVPAPEEPQTESPGPEPELEKLPNGYIPATKEVSDTDYAHDLAKRIAESNFPVTRVAFLDYKALFAEGLLANEDTNNPLPLKTGQRLVVDKDPNCARRTYWNAK